MAERGARSASLYVGSNWQRWEQVRDFLKAYAPLRKTVGWAGLIGWDWKARPEWADPARACRHRYRSGDARSSIGRRGEATASASTSRSAPLGKARFAPIFHRPLFRASRLRDQPHLRDLPRRHAAGPDAAAADFVEAIYGPAALTLVPGDDVAAFLTDALARPAIYWDAVMKTRAHLAVTTPTRGGSRSWPRLRARTWSAR